MTNRFLRSDIMFPIEKLKNKKIIIIGIGGVGGYTLEALVRTGVSNIEIYDYDTVDVTNINRQIIALNSTIGEKKVDVFEKRIKDINPLCNVKTHDMLIDENNINEVDLKADYVIDCIDMMKSKISLIKRCLNEKINIISATSAGGKKNIKDLRIDKLKNTSYCPVCKVLRKELKGFDLTVCYSTETSLKKQEFIPSNALVPAAMGLLIAEYVLKELIK